MDYNTLKVMVLGIFDSSSEYTSHQVRALLSTKGLKDHGEKALEMALLRYWRQGLLSRTRASGRYYYRLTARGAARKNWLLSQTPPLTE